MILFLLGFLFGVGATITAVIAAFVYVAAQFKDNYGRGKL
jgi:uncharacterized membrane protein YciS (DUF1049 family)